MKQETRRFLTKISRPMKTSSHRSSKKVCNKDGKEHDFIEKEGMSKYGIVTGVWRKDWDNNLECIFRLSECSKCKKQNLVIERRDIKSKKII